MWIVIFCFFLALAIAAGGVFSAANHAGAMRYVLCTALGKTRGNVTVKDIRFTGLKYSFPLSWVFDGVEIRILQGSKMVFVSAAELAVEDAGGLLFEGRTTKLGLKRAEMAWDKLTLKNVSGTAELSRTADGPVYKGSFSAGSLSWDKLAVFTLSGNFLGDAHKADMKDLKGDFYGGKLSGLAGIKSGPLPEYDINISLANADPELLARALGGAFREFSGRLTGSVRLAGQGTRINALNMSWNLPQGGEVSAALLSSVSAYFPPSVEKKRLDKLIRAGEKLAVEVFLFTMRNDAPDHLTGQIGLKSRRANLDLNVTHDISVDARVDSLLRAWAAVFKR